MQSLNILMITPSERKKFMQSLKHIEVEVDLDDHLVLDQDDPVGDKGNEDGDDAAESPQLKVGHCCKCGIIISPNSDNLDCTLGTSEKVIIRTLSK